jgi:hypothetical protein
MPKAARIATSASVSQASQNSDREQFVSIALFSGIGLLMSLLVVIPGVRGDLVLTRLIRLRTMPAAA